MSRNEIPTTNLGGGALQSPSPGKKRRIEDKHMGLDAFESDWIALKSDFGGKKPGQILQGRHFFQTKTTLDLQIERCYVAGLTKGLTDDCLEFTLTPPGSQKRGLAVNMGFSDLAQYPLQHTVYATALEDEPSPKVERALENVSLCGLINTKYLSTEAVDPFRWRRVRRVLFASFLPTSLLRVFLFL